MADEPPFNSEPEWVAAIPDESDRAAARAVLARKRWRESVEPPVCPDDLVALLDAGMTWDELTVAERTAFMDYVAALLEASKCRRR